MNKRRKPWWIPFKAPVVMGAEGLARLRPGNPSLLRKPVELAARAGDGPRTGRVARRLLDTLASSPGALGALLRAGARRAKPPRRLDHSLALEALGDVQDRLAPHGLQPFLVFGTLLGAVRDGAFIPGDADIDTGVLGEDRLVALHAVLEKHELAASAIRYVGGRPYKLGFTHRNGVMWDVKVFRPEPDGTTTWDTCAENVVLRKRFPRHFDLVRMAFQGLSVLVPDCAEEFLEWQYGPGWRTPDPTYHRMASGPLHGPEHRAWVWAVGPRAILRLLALGRVARPLNMARSLGALFPEEDLWPRLAAALEHQLSDRSPGPGGRAAPGSGR